MASPINPLADNVVAQIEVAATKTASGILLPENAAEKPKTAKVVAIGPNVAQVKVGDRVLYKSFPQPEAVSVGKDEYIIMREEDILATVK